MRKLILSTVAAIGMATVAVGALNAQGAPAPGTIDLAAVQSGTYTADSAHSMVNFHINHLGFNDYIGIFGDVAGTLTIDKANIGSAKVDVTIPVSKVVTASAGLTAHLLKAAGADGKADFFGAAPADAKFVSTAVKVSGQNATITGNLTLNGQTKPVTLEAKFYGAGKSPMGGAENVGFTATGSFKRSEFGINYALPMISDEVKLKISAAFVKAG